MPVPRFMLFDCLGGLFWVATFTGLGFIFSNQLEQIAAYSLRWGGWLVVILVGSLAAYILWKYVQRQRFLHRLRIARISPKELMEKLTAGDEVYDRRLASAARRRGFPQMIPGALRMAMEEIEKRHQEIPRDRDIVLYCS